MPPRLRRQRPKRDKLGEQGDASQQEGKQVAHVPAIASKKGRATLSKAKAGSRQNQAPQRRSKHHAPASSKPAIKLAKWQELSPRDKVTPFRARVFAAVRTIPEGKVTTYGRIATAINCKSAQAIGQAMRHNPFATYRYAKPYPDEMVPCHRVVATDCTLGGFSGATALDSPQLKKKVDMLKGEGVIVTKTHAGKIKVHKSCVIDPQPPTK